MASFKAQSLLHGGGDDSDDSDDSDEDEQQVASEESAQDRENAESAESASSEESDDDASADEEAAPGSSAQPLKTSAEKRLERKRQAEWLASRFIKAVKNEGSTIYKSELLPDKVFFSLEKVEQFVNGKRYKRLMHEMRKSMRTHADNEKLRLKAEARRERQEERRAEKRRQKVAVLRKLPEPDDQEEIERRKAQFQAKKARRLARKAAAAEG